MPGLRIHGDNAIPVHPCRAKIATVKLHLLNALFLAALLTACSPLSPRIGAPSQWIPSPNFDARRPNLVIIHHTSDDTMAQAQRTLTT